MSFCRNDIVVIADLDGLNKRVKRGDIGVIDTILQAEEGYYVVVTTSDGLLGQYVDEDQLELYIKQPLTPEDVVEIAHLVDSILQL